MDRENRDERNLRRDVRRAGRLVASLRGQVEGEAAVPSLWQQGRQGAGVVPVQTRRLNELLGEVERIQSDLRGLGERIVVLRDEGDAPPRYSEVLRNTEAASRPRASPSNLATAERSTGQRRIAEGREDVPPRTFTDTHVSAVYTNTATSSEEAVALNAGEVSEIMTDLYHIFSKRHPDMPIVQAMYYADSLRLAMTTYTFSTASDGNRGEQDQSVSARGHAHFDTMPPPYIIGAVKRSPCVGNTNPPMSVASGNEPASNRSASITRTSLIDDNSSPRLRRIETGTNLSDRAGSHLRRGNTRQPGHSESDTDVSTSRSTLVNSSGSDDASLFAQSE